MSVKKKATSSRSAQTKAKAAGSAQSAAERRSVEAETSALIEKFSPSQQPLVSKIRRSLMKRLPTAHEIVYEYRDAFVISYSPNEHGYNGVLAIRGSADGIRLYFTRGKDLPDPAKLLQGSSQTRFVNIEGTATLALPAVVSLIEEAIARNTVPFAETGRGSVIMSPSTSAKKRQQRRPA